MNDSLAVFQHIVGYIEADRTYVNQFPKGEPQLGKRGLYDNVGGRNDSKKLQLAFLWVLNYSDGAHTLTDICMLSGMELSHHPRSGGDMLLVKGT